MGTVPTMSTWSSGAVDADDFNTQLRDTINWLLDVPRILVGRSSVFAVVNQSYRSLNWNTELFKADFSHDNTTNPRMITVNTPGLYLVFANIEYAGVASTSGQRRVDLSLNGDAGPTGTSTPPAGSTLFAFQNAQGPATNLPGRISVSGFYRAVAGDFFQVLTYQSSGGSLNMTVDSTFGAVFLAR